VKLDNSPIHKSKKFKAKIKDWKEKDLLIYFLHPVFSGIEFDRNPMVLNQIPVA